MPHETPIPELEHQDIGLDAIIIANARLRALQAAGQALGHQGRRVQPFRCYRRGYLIQGRIILMFDPSLIDIHSSTLNLLDASDAPVEVWILEDDRVAGYFELGSG